MTPLDPSPPIAKWHVVISGFLQTAGQPHGLQILWKRLHYEHAAQDQYVMFETWKADWSDTAEWIWRCSNSNPEIKLYGYSWGGASAMILAKQLRLRGLKVKAMVLSDPVHRHRYWFGRWRVFFHHIPLLIPDNVREVHWYRQVNSWPCGHDLVAEDTRKTKIHSAVVLTVSHQYMDDSMEFYHRCLQVAA